MNTKTNTKTKDHTEDIVREVVLETGCSVEVVKKVLNSFIGVFTDKVSDGVVLIEGLGKMTAVMKQRRFYDINKNSMNETPLRPKIKFVPSDSFLNLVRHGYNVNNVKE
jgi:Bacterial DNA-binding protein